MQEAEQPKICKRCLNEKPAWHFARWASTRDHWCRECKTLYPKAWKPEANHRYRMLHKYGLYPEDLERLRAEKPGCWCCGRRNVRRVVDHCHDTGRFRGLCCGGCNSGTVGDDVAFMRMRIEYLERPLPDVPRRPKTDWTPDETKHVLYTRFNDLANRWGKQMPERPPEWKYFEGFLLWSLAAGWENGMRLLRKGNRGEYSPDNCYWSWDQLDGRPYQEKLVDAWGESKIPSDWLLDPRVKVPSRVCFYSRVYRGWSPEEALALSLDEGLLRACRTVAIFGEEKTVADWIADHRAGDGLTRGAFLQRLGKEWDPERALTTSARNGIYEVDGIAKTTKEWVKDPISKVSYRTLARRIAEGWDFLEALTTRDGRLQKNIPVLSSPPVMGSGKPQKSRSNAYGTRMMTIFGETKSMSDWSRDERCVVSYTCLNGRISKGTWDYEEAIITPSIKAPKVTESPASSCDYTDLAG